MKLNTMVAASLLTLTAIGAHADVFDWGEHDLLESALGLPAAGVFFDTYSFSLAVESNVASSVTSVGAINSGMYGLFSVGLDGLMGTGDDVGLGAWTYGGAPTVSEQTLEAGNYYYSVFGVAVGAAAYSLNSAAMATPVPEPGSYALLALGLSVVGLTVSRRRRAT
jgi:hypothetical protein